MAHITTNSLSSGAKSYTVVWRDRRGRQRQQSFKTKKVAEQKLAQVVLDKDTAGAPDPRGPKQPFHVVADKWLDAREVRESTRRRYRQLLEVHVNPAVGDYPIATITAEDVERWLAAMKRQKHGKNGKRLRPATIARAFGVVRSVLKYAHRHGYVTQIATTGIRIPTAASMGTTEFEGRDLSVAEVDAICACLYNDAYSVLLVRFLAYTGLRAGEVAGLNMADVDLHRKTVTVRRTWSHGTLSEPKSSSSRRTVPLDPELVPLLREYVAAHPDSGNPGSPFFLSRVGSGMYTTDFIWPGRERKFAHGSAPTKPRPLQAGRRWDAAAFSKTSFRLACGMAGLGHVRVHDLRHAFASEQLRAGASLFEVARLMGHSDIKLVAKTYGHHAQETAENTIARTAAHRAAARRATRM